MGRDHLHSVGAQEISDRWHRVGKPSQVCVRLNLVILYKNILKKCYNPGKIFRFKKLTVQRLSNQDSGVSLQSNHLDLIDTGHIIKALSIDEHLKATSHRDFCHSRPRGFVSMTYTFEWRV